MTRRHAASFSDELDGFAESLSAAWTVIRCFPIDRRPTFIAANLIRDVEYRVYRLPYRRKFRLVPVEAEHFERQIGTGDVADTEDPRAELHDLLRRAARAGISADDLELARRLATGASTAELAAELHVTDRTIRNRRSAVILRLRDVALADDESAVRGAA